MITQKHSLKVFAVSDYKEPLKSLILAKTWSDRVASCQIAELIWQMTYVKNTSYDYIVPVPLYWARFAKRGFNQAEQIAYELAKKNNKKVIRLLKRRYRTTPQSELKHDQRDANVAYAFIVSMNNKDIFKGSHLLLVDDLMTTGATLKACARELLKLKPASITAVVACRVV